MAELRKPKDEWIVSLACAFNREEALLYVTQGTTQDIS